MCYQFYSRRLNKKPNKHNFRPFSRKKWPLFIFYAQGLEKTGLYCLLVCRLQLWPCHLRFTAFLFLEYVPLIASTFRWHVDCWPCTCNLDLEPVTPDDWRCGGMIFHHFTVFSCHWNKQPDTRGQLFCHQAAGLFAMLTFPRWCMYLRTLLFNYSVLTWSVSVCVKVNGLS